MPSWNFVRDSLLVAAIVVCFAGAAALTGNLVQVYMAGGDRAIPNPVVIAALYFLGFGLMFLLWRSQADHPKSGSTAPLK